MAMTQEQLINSDPMELTPELIAKRRELIKLRTEEALLDKALFDATKYKEDKLAKDNRAKAGRESHEAYMRKTELEKLSCAHMTGGSGLGGWFAGDGTLYGSATSVQELPTGEIVITCFRCQNEWRRPSKRAVIDGKLSYAEYREQEEEFNKMLRARRISFDGINGEWMAASRFLIPALIDQQRKDDIDFDAYVKQNHPGPGRPRK
jgi:hypothetical protein